MQETPVEWDALLDMDVDGLSVARRITALKMRKEAERRRDKQHFLMQESKDSRLKQYEQELVRAARALILLIGGVPMASELQWNENGLMYFMAQPDSMHDMGPPTSVPSSVLYVVCAGNATRITLNSQPLHIPPVTSGDQTASSMKMQIQ